jgi:hypothetical protein
MPEATTNASGQFSFTTTPGKYLLIVGPNSSTATTATLHETVTLASGPNILTAQTPQPEPDVTPQASQIAGALRLMALNSVQQDCLTGMNTGRAGASLTALVPDEYLEEDVLAINAEEDAQATDTPTPLFGGYVLYGQFSDMATSAGFNPCDTWTDGYSFTSGNPPYQAATNASNIWYGGVVDETNYPYYGSQLWATDPR